MQKKHYLTIAAFLMLLVAVYVLPLSNPQMTEAQTPHGVLEGESNLSNVVKIYIPSRTKEGEQIAPSIRDGQVDDALTTFSEMFGGATAIEGQGAWVNDAGKLMKEEVTIVYSFADNFNNRAIDKVVAYAKKVRNELDQSSVSLEVNGKMYFIE